MLPELQHGERPLPALTGEYSSGDEVQSYEATVELLRRHELMPEDVRRRRAGDAAVKVMTVLGTRPEIIRLSRVIPLLDDTADHTLVHTGQNFDPTLSDVFFEELGVRDPDVALGVRGDTFAQQFADLMTRIEPVFADHRPDRLLILGDTNSGLVSILANRLGIPVFHMEAGNRCYDDRVPEEVNRRIIDHCSTVLLPYTFRSKENLVREGIERARIFVTGNPIKEVMDHVRGAGRRERRARTARARAPGLRRS